MGNAIGIPEIKDLVRGKQDAMRGKNRQVNDFPRMDRLPKNTYSWALVSLLRPD
jgi:hypothetical protein